jgi:hypothetical protein
MRQKTKRTIIENEELKAEVQYHTHATMTLWKENERLIEENHEFTRQIGLLKEVPLSSSYTLVFFYNTVLQSGNFWLRFYFWVGFYADRLCMLTSLAICGRT